MTNGGDRNGGALKPPELTWANIIGTIVAAAILAGAGWTLFQTQFNYLQRSDDTLRADLIRRTAETEARFNRIEDELKSRRAEFVHQDEFRAHIFANRATQDKTDTRLNTIEQTRPTTGELQAINKFTTENMSRILDRMDKLENKMMR